jgi:hypothetical protein
MANKEMRTDTSLIGAAGEHLVLSRLLAMGILAAQAPRGTRKADILVNHLDGKAPCLIQVKTRSGKGSDISWHMKAKHEAITDKDMFYCFVDLGSEPTNIYVIPAAKVAKVVSESHAVWLHTPGKNGRAHKETVMRRIITSYKSKLKSAPANWMDKYLEAWDLIR